MVEEWGEKEVRLGLWVGTLFKEHRRGISFSMACAELRNMSEEQREIEFAALEAKKGLPDYIWLEDDPDIGDDESELGAERAIWRARRLPTPSNGFWVTS